MCAQFFPKESPPAWYIGTIRTKPVPKGAKDAWINFPDTPYNFDVDAELVNEDDVKINVDAYDHGGYMKTWVLLRTKEVRVDELFCKDSSIAKIAML